MNRRCLEILGYSREELLHLTFDLALVEELLDGERPSYSMEKRYIRKNSDVVWANLTVSLVHRPDGSPDCFISVIEDITLRKRVERERDELIAHLEDRVRERTADLERLSLLDPLTGIANRRSFDQCLEAEWNRAVRTRQPLSLVLIDIDYFKQVKDSLGHSAADDALKALASCLVQVAKRSTDLRARFGGDELILVLPDTDADGAMKIANRIQDMVKALIIDIRSPSDSKLFSVSQGVAAAVPDRKGTWKGLLLDADRALYRAKQSGCGRVALWASSRA